jgi:hypothetical protein
MGNVGRCKADLGVGTTLLLHNGFYYHGLLLLLEIHIFMWILWKKRVVFNCRLSHILNFETRLL